ncbi:MFS transporter [Pseudorhodobacter sp. E13]|uniref:MFS transporter n=1 Tax=Pseudorhodobacter sp. E13 TaxID=2487931 RepID=UPI000F8E6109|nr:MFS transporter [Pseudorhodobacter sp. E13]RUS59790.1 MFS transporter [Pseudorhodobacter sp. E13]
MKTPTLAFLRDNAPFLATGALLSFLSSFGQTFFISIFGGEIRAHFGLSNGDWGVIYMVGTGFSALAMVFAGGLADRFRVRVLGVAVVGLLGLACLAMAFNPWAAALPLVIFALRFTGQGMTSHVAVVAMVRWFVAARGRALAVATMGFMTAEALMPLTFVWLKQHIDWHLLWVGAALFCFLCLPILHRLLRLERTPQSSAESNATLGMNGRHWTRAEALRHPLFWSLTPALLFFPAFGTAFWFHQVHFAEIKGWDHLALVAVFPLGTLTFGLFTLVYGWAIDRFGAARLLPIYLLPLILAFSLHAFAPSLGWAAAGVILMGMAGGGQSTIPNAVWAEFYGTRHLGAIKSAVAAVMVLGSAIGPGLSGALIDAGIGYETQLYGFAASFAFAVLVMLLPLARARAALSVAA